MTPYQTNSVEEVVDFVRSAGSFELKKGMLNKWVFKRGNDEYYLADFLRERITTLVEQAKGEQKIDENTSDGYHTFKELYEFRKLYNAVLFNEWYAQGKYQVHKSTKHADGEDCFGGGWFIVMATLPTGQISNHYEMKDWDTFACETRDKADVWDGHTAQDVAQRLAELTARTISSDEK